MTNSKTNTDAGKDIISRLEKEYIEGFFNIFYVEILNHAKTEEDIVKYAKEFEIDLNPGEPKLLLEYIDANRYILVK